MMTMEGLDPASVRRLGARDDRGVWAGEKERARLSRLTGPSSVLQPVTALQGGGQDATGPLAGRVEVDCETTQL